MNRDEQIQKLSRASDWRAALVILRSAFADDGRVWRYVDLDGEEIAFRKILDDGTFSSGEKMLLSIAASLFNREHRINLWEVFNRLDEPNTASSGRCAHSVMRGAIDPSRAGRMLNGASDTVEGP